MQSVVGAYITQRLDDDKEEIKGQLKHTQEEHYKKLRQASALIVAHNAYETGAVRSCTGQLMAISVLDDLSWLDIQLQFRRPKPDEHDRFRDGVVS